jgi:plasmid stability protein
MGRPRWTKEELKILRDAWVRGMTTKGISSTLLKHRTLSAINQIMAKHGITLRGRSDRKRALAITIGLPEFMVERLKSSAAAHGVSVNQFCRDIIQQAMRNENVGRNELSHNDYCRERMREWRARKRQKGAAE